LLLSGEHQEGDFVSGARAGGRGPEIILALLLVLVGAASWWISLRPRVELRPASLEQIPFRLGAWSGVDLPMASSVESMLQADSHVQRAYRSDDGQLVWLYVGYYGTEQGGRPEHTPWACYPSAGWTIERSSERPILSDSTGASRGAFNELLVERGGERRLVHFWYRTHRSWAIASEGRLTLDHLLGRLSHSARADGALVRLSTPIDARGLSEARRRLARFTETLGVELSRHWPSTAGDAEQ